MRFWRALEAPRGVWRRPGGGLEGSGGDLEEVWRASGGVLEGVWRHPGENLEHVVLFHSFLGAS
eukprot:2421958-Karenia_brevis.AAC.1